MMMVIREAVGKLGIGRKSVLREESSLKGQRFPTLSHRTLHVDMEIFHSALSITVATAHMGLFDYSKYG